MVSMPTKAGLTAGAGTAVAGATGGLDRAAQAAGDTLRGIFKGLPWEMSWQNIVDAVSGNAGEAAGILVGGVL